MSEIQKATVVEFIPMEVWAEKDWVGTVSIKMQYKDAPEPFTFVQIHYDHRYTHNSGQWSLTKQLMESLGVKDWNQYSPVTPNPEMFQKHVCNWTQPTYDDSECNAWQTDCGEYFAITEGKPSENSMRFCHGCGKPVAEHPYEYPEDDEWEDE